MKTSLVTGGTGFIGSYVVDNLINFGHNVIILDDLSGSTKKHLNPEAIFIQGSILDTELLQDLFEKYKFNYVYHLAAYAAEGLSHFIRSFNYHNNLIGSINLINESIKHKIECFVYTSSIAVYGENQLPMIENHIPIPLDPYGISKYAVERDLMAAKEMFDLNSIIFRPHNVYGERQNINDRYRNVACIFMNQILKNEPVTVVGEGLQSRAFTHVLDVAPHIANSINIQEAYNQTINIGNDEHYSINELAKTLYKIFDKPENIKFEDARKEVIHAYSDHSKFKKIFKIDNNSTINFLDGLTQTVHWIKTQTLAKSDKFKGIEITENLPKMWL